MTKIDDAKKCNFCGKDKWQVSALLVSNESPPTAICNGCVTISLNILLDRVRPTAVAQLKSES